ncbi:MAG TPA: VWA-like domain-containing protein [Candidatus Hydrogenedentes bacterium]|nr:VWA-like domain-containing protein [Candidatus Hydrogenedentota bacterium]
MDRITQERKEATRIAADLLIPVGEIIVTDAVPTAAVDKDGNLYMNSNFVEKAGLPLGYVILHEALHIALRHYERMGDRDPQRWNIAADCAVAVILKHFYGYFPDGIVSPEMFHLPEDSTTEQFYEMLPPDAGDRASGKTDDNFLPNRPWEKKTGSESQRTVRVPISPEVGKFLADRMPGSREIMTASLSHSPGGLAERMSANVEVDMRLFDFVVAYRGWGDYSYSRPNFRNFEPVIAPGFSEQPSALVVLDTSASMYSTAKRCLSLINGLVASGVRVRLAMGDTELTSFIEIDTPQSQYDVTGIGGTDMAAVYRQVLEQAGSSDVIVMFTDCYTDFPKQDEIVVPLYVVCVDDRTPPKHIPYIMLSE